MELDDEADVPKSLDAPGLVPETGHVTRRGLMLVLSSPSGAGKSTISRLLLETDAHIALSVSATTRAPRPGEIDGVHYHFMDRPGFEALVERHGFLEWAHVFDHLYGTPKEPVEKALDAGKDVLFDIDWQGTQQIAAQAPHDLVRVFILPPSIAELAARLRRRAQDSDEVVARRMAKASAEISHWDEYDYVIVNRDIDESLRRLRAILQAERIRRARQTGLADFVGWLQADL